MSGIKKGLKWLFWLILCFILLIAAFVAVQWLRASNAQPVLSGDLNAVGVSSATSVSRDEYGVTYINAKSETDALFALGFAHAQDRLWQMDMVRRIAAGRLSEFIGPPTVGFDAFMRHWQFPKRVEESWAAFNAADKARVEAYAAGVNAYLSSPLYKRTPEHIWLMADMEPWKPTDSLLVTKMLWVNLSTNLFEEFTRERLAKLVSPDFATAYIRPYPDDGHVAMAWPDLARTLGLPEDGRAVVNPVQQTVSPSPDTENSNNWVVAGARSQSGKPMLANDPHLGLSMPGFWYLAQLRYGDAQVAGGTIPGIPAIVVGHNRDVSWGTTNGHDSDVQDVHRHQLHPDNSGQYRTPDGWAEFETREETIGVRFGEDVTRSFRKTALGPVLEAGGLPVQLPQEEGVLYSLAWTALDGPDLTLSAIMAMSRASALEDIQAAVKRYAGPPQNIVYGLANGDIGLVVAGKVPIRQAGHETQGGAPSDAWKSVNHWQGMIPAQLTPRVDNPASGMLVTANARVVPDAYPYRRSVDSGDPSRQQRIYDLLAAKARHDLESFSAIQLDTTAPVAADLLPALLTTQPADPDAAQALGYLRDWDGAWAADGPGPVIFAQWISLLTQALVWDELGDAAPQFSRVSMRRLDAILNGPLAAWCDDKTSSPDIETCDVLLTETLSASAAALKREHGRLEDLTWADIHRDRHGHLGLGVIPVLGDALSRETKRPAGPDAPNVASLRADSLPKAAGGGFGPSMRFIVDMAEPENALYAISSGQSGHYASDHYDDLQALWARGQYIRIDPARVDPEKTIRINPAARD